LRERTEDILPIASRMLAEERTSARGFSRAAKARLLGYDWPGNVRELQNAVKHGAALAAGPQVDDADLPDALLTPAPRTRAGAGTALRPLADVEREHILGVLDACGGSQADAARILGIARNTLWRKLRTYGNA